ncbi:MAG: hypothetical protein JNL05_04270 [Flavobacteriales bacterium]|nr:hypothetical protein [Flavobacteriales bacterium]
MEIDIRGKIKEKKLAYSHTLLPLYEALVNSIHAIEELGAGHQGLITVTLGRLNQPELPLDGEATLPPIIDFTVEDNGIGFNAKNYESFNYAHSTYKEKRGGKGIGRFTWLRAFTKVEVDSVYRQEQELRHRTFDFLPSRKGIENATDRVLDGTSPCRTSVRLKGLREDYHKWCNNDPEDIAVKVIEHCFVFFLNPSCPTIRIIDGDRTIVVNDLFQVYTKGHVVKEERPINGIPFDVRVVKLYHEREDNKIHYCAHTREVQREKLSLAIPDLDRLIEDEHGQYFSIAAYVSSPYLDESVNEERTRLDLRSGAEEDELRYTDSISLDQVRAEVVEVIRAHFADHLHQLSDMRMQRVRQFVVKHPRYRHLIKYRAEEVRRVPSNLSDERMEVELFKIQQGLELEVMSEANKAMGMLSRPDELEHLKEKLGELYNKIIEVGGSKLAEYVMHRRTVIDLLEKHLGKGAGNAAAREEAVHKLIFPLKTFSDDIGFEDHNLWLIDERLAFHTYLASDKPMKELKAMVSSDSKDRPDLIVFNTAFALSRKEKPYDSVVLVEFKKPLRDDYSEKENPIAQVTRYARELNTPSTVDKDNRPLDLRANTPIYAYIVCDLTPKLRDFARDAGYRQLPDNDGFFHYNENYHLYTEIISFDKLIRDSKARNQALFTKLSLPVA